MEAYRCRGWPISFEMEKAMAKAAFQEVEMQHAHFQNLHDTYIESLKHRSSGTPTIEQLNYVSASCQFGCQNAQAQYTSLANEHALAMDELCRLYPAFNPYPTVSGQNVSAEQSDGPIDP